jgi:hypothetical protein
VESLTEAVKVKDAAPTVGFGLTAMLEVKGPVVSGGAETVKVCETVAPQLLAASLPCT